ISTALGRRRRRRIVGFTVASRDEDGSGEEHQKRHEPRSDRHTGTSTPHAFTERLQIDSTSVLNFLQSMPMELASTQSLSIEGVILLRPRTIAIAASLV